MKRIAAFALAGAIAMTAAAPRTASAATAFASLDFTAAFLGESSDLFFTVDKALCAFAGCTRVSFEGNATASAMQTPVPADVPDNGFTAFLLEYEATATASAAPTGKGKGQAEGLTLFLTFYNLSDDPLSVLYGLEADLTTLADPGTGRARARGDVNISIEDDVVPGQLNTVLAVGPTTGSDVAAGSFAIPGGGTRFALIDSGGVLAFAAEVPLPGAVWSLGAGLALLFGAGSRRARLTANTPMGT